jgi:hypothetical protein
LTYKSISETDPWPDKCPNPEDLSRRELITFFENWEHAPLTQWEVDFVESLHERMLDGLWPTQKQFDLLNKGLFKRLWDNDPALWED